MKDFYCNGCYKYDKKANKCLAFKELYPHWHDYSEDVDCWGRVDDPREWMQVIRDVEKHQKLKEKQISSISAAQRRWMAYTDKQKPKLIREINKIENKEIELAMMEDQKRGKGGGGEKNMDGSAFGPAQMKDNRFPHRKNNPKKWNGWH